MTIKELKNHVSSPRIVPPAERFIDEFCAHAHDNAELLRLLDVELVGDVQDLVEALSDYAQRRIDGEIT